RSPRYSAAMARNLKSVLPEHLVAQNAPNSHRPTCSRSLTTQLAEIAEKLEELKQSLLELDVELEVKLNPNIHDREIRLDNGWIIKIGRGLDFYQKPGGWFEVGANDLSLRKCLETKVDIFRG
ncbi:MIT C-terminal domain-containing protein, partial [Paraburkholderia sp. RL17-373-BIF-A]|uniref:MIT C-terminal domain-containing protein n=1 Tax=Paraburkholderia sp. RL17-373-BIF-A TaxID=3031629 RepID=UPI0038BC6D7E